MTTTDDLAPTEPLRQRIPASVAVAGARRRVAVVVGILLAVLAVQVPIQASISEDAAVFPLLGLDVLAGIVAWTYVRGLSVARGDVVEHGPDGRYVTARTRSGPRTLDLGELRRVGSRRIYYGVALTFAARIVVRDTAGTRMAFDGGQTWRGLRKAVEATDPTALRISRLARRDLEMTRDGAGLSGVYSFFAFFEFMAGPTAGMIVFALLSTVV